VSPEKLFIEDLSRYNRRIAMVCVDEIHCSSEWSHNFRPAYLKLNDMIKEKVAHANKVFLNNLRNTSSKTKGLKDLDENCVILGLTATATKATQSSICKNFEIKHPDNIITEPNLARLNLSLSITRDPEKLKGLLTLL
jgi:superfamily II DNA helicase RecQ